MSSSDLQTLEKQARLESTPIAGINEDSTTLRQEAKECTGDPDSSNDLVRLLRCLEKVRQWRSLFRILNLTEPRFSITSIPPVPSSRSVCPYSGRYMEMGWWSLTLAMTWCGYSAV